nr:PREDICTED: thyroid adenoma-associated protein homolog isoform X1 [Lepisosteus oculatus]
MFQDASSQKQSESCLLFFKNTDARIPVDVRNKLITFLEKLIECARSSVKRSRERNLEEALLKLKRLTGQDLSSLENEHLGLLVQLVLAFQLESLDNSTAFRKLDQMMVKLSEGNQLFVFEAIQTCLSSTVDFTQILSVSDFHTVCLFLEDSSAGREVWRKSCLPLLSKLAETFPSILEQEASRNGEHCYLAVKVCLQMFQLLPEETAPLIWEENPWNPVAERILKHLLNIVLGESSNRDTRLLAGTAVAMAMNTAPQAQDGGAAVLSLLQLASTDSQMLRVGSLTVACRARSRDGVDRLAVTRGLLTCCRKDILLSPLENKGTCLLLDGVFPVISGLCEENLDCHYYIFQVFAMWLRSLKESLQDVWVMRGTPLLSENSRLQQQLSTVIWNNAESPVEGISEFVHSSFRQLLEIYELECEHFTEEGKPLYTSLLHRITSLPWEAKAKYFPLCALLPYVGTNRVLEYFADLPRQLLKCLSTNHLSPCASEVYKSLIRHQRQELCVANNHPSPSEKDLAEHWAERWYPTLLEALTSDLTLLQNNASSYLLPWTLRVFPAAFEILQGRISLTRSGHLRAWASLLSVQRTVTGSSPLSRDLLSTLRLALGSLDDSVRLAAVSLLCCGPKTSQPPTELELSEMRDFIPLNLNSDSSPFRQHFQAGVKRLLVRIRDSGLACLRGRQGKEEREARGGGDEGQQDLVLARGVDFVDWLTQLCFCYLAPGFNYQRKKTVLLLLSAVLETCTDSWSPEKKKGQPPVDMSALLRWTRQRGQWDFFCRTNLLVLLRCLEDGTNEIRELTAELLLRFFPPLLPRDLSPPLFERAQKLMRSPRVQDAQAGALAMKIVLLKSDELSSVLKTACKGKNERAPTQEVKVLSMVLYLLQELEQQHLAARRDMLHAARTNPIHGVLIALQRCLLEPPDAFASIQKAEESPGGPDLIPRLLETVEKISLFLLGVLYGDPAGAAEEQDAPPSFCDMGKAIRSVIARGEEEEEGCVLLSEEHSLVLTCCWVSLKEIGIFLGRFVEKGFSTAPTAASGSLFTMEDLKRIAKVFKDILLKCRHWGAVEGCCVGFTRFCAVLLNHPDPVCQEIPAQMLEQGLSVLQSPRSSSVTRRAAGLPMLIVSIVAAENASKARPLLALSMTGLLETASAPLPQDWDQTLDLPQVCAVHALQALVRSAGLGVAVLQFAPTMTILSLNTLSSPCWAMRNAAIQLFSALCSRMLGQRSRGEDGCPQHGMSPPAFFTRYPALQPFLLGELVRAAGPQGARGEARLHLHPSLHSVLTLLAKLQPGAHNETRSLAPFLPPLLQLASSPIYAVRVMASKALAAMTPPSEYMSTLLQLAGQLLQPHAPRCHNGLHGQLLQIGALLARALRADGAQTDAMRGLAQQLESGLWLATSAQECPLIRSAYLSVAAQLAGSFTQSFVERLQSSLVTELQSPRNRLQVGSAVFCQNAVNLLCDEAVRSRDHQRAAQAWKLLSVEDPDVGLSLVSWARDGQSWMDTDIQPVLAEALGEALQATLMKGSAEYKKTFLEAFVAVMSSCAESPSPEALPPWRTASLASTALLLALLESQDGGPELRSQALCAAGLLLSQSCEDSLTERWCRLLETHRTPETPETLRLACTHALQQAGMPLVSRTLRGVAPKPALSVRLINTAIHLLQDESQQIRTEAAKFASVLHSLWKGGTEGQGPCFQMQVNQGLLGLLELLLEEFWDSPGTLGALLSHLPDGDLKEALRGAQDADAECTSLYEQDDANVFEEPSVMSELLLPYLIQLADKTDKPSHLKNRLAVWAAENTAGILNNIHFCKQLFGRGDEAVALGHLGWQCGPCFHGHLAGLFARAGFLLHLLEASEDHQPLAPELHCPPQALWADLQETRRLLSQHGVLVSVGIDWVGTH